MNDAVYDEIGIRGTPGGGNLLYTTNAASFGWFGSGIMDKPIGDFFSGNTETYRNIMNAANAPYFVSRPGTGNVSTRFHRHVIPEPEEYALVFGVFALAFVIFRRRFQKKGLN